MHYDHIKVSMLNENAYLSEGSFNFFNCSSNMSIKMNDSKEVKTQSICQATKKPEKRKKIRH